MKQRIVQFSAGFLAGDAISNEMIAIDNYFSARGRDTAMYANFIGKFEGIKKARRSFYYSPDSNDIIIYHYSIHSRILNKISNLPVKKILVYHNVTPHHFFEPYSLELSHYLRQGREELYELRNLFDLSLADSDYNAAELKSLGFKNVKTMPIQYEFDRLQKFPRGNDSKIKKIIFVGRVVPNKKQDDLIRFAAAFSKYVTRDFELEIIGYCPKELLLYREELDRMVEYYGLENNVKFTDYVDDNILFDKYSQADLFLTMSEHEGFCVPVLEAMFYDIPVMAYDSTAVRETLDKSGVLFRKKDFSYLALMAEKLLFDNDLRNKIISGQRKRIERYQKLNPVQIIEEELGN